MIKKEDWFTIPNILSYIRILMLPLYIYLFINAETSEDYYWAAFILVLSGITDALDGFIARNTGQITELGKILDPVADKLTQVTVVGVMIIQRPYIFPLLLLFIIKELYLLINNIILYKKNIIMDGAMWFGKVSTAVFYVCTFVLVVFPNFNKNTSLLLINITAIFQLVSLLGYARWFIHEYRKHKLNSEK